MENNDLRLLTAVVQRRLGDRVVDAALKAGATGVTYFFAQGSGVRQRLGVFGHLIEAEKQVIFVVSTSAHIDKVMEAVAEAGELNKAAYGFAYVQEVTKAVGFIEPSSAKPTL